MAKNEEEDNKVRDAVIEIILTVISYYILKSFFDFLQKKGISKGQFLVGIVILSYTLFFIVFIISLIIKWYKVYQLQ